MGTRLSAELGKEEGAEGEELHSTSRRYTITNISWLLVPPRGPCHGTAADVFLPQPYVFLTQPYVFLPHSRMLSWLIAVCFPGSQPYVS